ncbi:MAG: chromosome segregation protein SMC [Alicyclobacillus sp.]|nr:chromosome segregation protein SMC [Alicyclobacillus sp.]
MFLKRIEITGFKSFAEKTSIDFAPGITAVVGPNGSGKSNISDAIRWVLGEQSARTLRGAKMEDIIFAGSESRKPVNFCEVSLTLDNSDGHLPVPFDEVTVTRRVYRSGDSEYLINQQTCRLKDVSELFMDSGLGREAYSIVGQGKIEEMLSTRPEDRRGAFEDAAGIVKFKFRRKEAERRLEETEQNLLRVDDILDELTQQAGPLEREAERAARFQALTEEHRLLDIGLLVVEIETLTERWKQAQEALAEVAARREERRLEFAAAEANLDAKRAQLETQRSASSAIQAQYVDAVELRQALQGRLDLLQERLTYTEERLAEQTAQETSLAGESAELAARAASLSNRLQELVAMREVKAAELEAASDAVNPAVKARLEEEIARLNEVYIDLHQQLAGHRNDAKAAEERVRSDEARRARAEAEREQLRQEADRWESVCAEKAMQLEEQRAAVGETVRQLDAGAETQHRLATAEAGCAAQLHRLDADIASLRSRRELLTELQAGYDGYALGTKTVLQLADKGRLQGIHGAVAGLFRVDKRFELAVETALGGALQNIVVAEEADARAAIDVLKQRHAGRATFLPLSVLRSRLLSGPERERAARVTGFLGLASELVATEAEFRPVAEHLLGNVVVADTLVHAGEIARALGYRVRIVSLEGDVVSPGGAMTGGSFQRKGPGLLGRSRELEEVEESIRRKLEERNRVLSQQRELREQLQQTEAQQRERVARRDELQETVHRLQSEWNDAKTRWEHAQDRIQAADWSLAELADGRSAWMEQKQAAEAAVQETTAEIERVGAALSRCRAQLQDREEHAAAHQSVLTALQVDLAKLEQECASVEQQRVEMQERTGRVSERRAQLQRELVALREQRVQTQTERMETEQRLSEVSNRLAELEAETGTVRHLLQELESGVLQSEREVRERQQQLTAADEQVHRVELQVERADVELDHALQRMGEAHHMTYEWARTHHALTVDPALARQRADQLRREISAMGDVHLGAVEEWQRLSERLAFLTRERDDLREAKDRLTAVIAELDDEMAKRFAEAFEQIRVAFQASFRQLFGGGRADLTLTEPADVLNTGIEVIAQPPGKKLQNLNLLSGGERALTAMALLFAILKVRPVPFCVLDEVEAALDEANVGRFAGQLRAFSHDTQFIVVTHRRATMEEADVLYGVTMQESGISSLIGVRLEEAEFDHESAG